MGIRDVLRAQGRSETQDDRRAKLDVSLWGSIGAYTFVIRTVCGPPFPGECGRLTILVLDKKVCNCHSAR